jgi:di/tricarboxylate transporter
MKHSHAANAAIVLVIIGWFSYAYGVFSQMGDPVPWVTKAELEAHRLVAVTFMLLGVLLVLSSLWLSGYAFSSARWRSAFTTLCAVVPVVVLFFFAFVSK